MGSLHFTPPQRQKSTNISDILQSFQDGNQVQEVIISWIVDPPFDWYGIVYVESVNVRRSVQQDNETFVENIA